MIVNEAGAVALDAKLVVGTREAVIEIRDGCVCCTVRGDLAVAVGKLLDRRQSFFGRLRFEHILVECSGLASPGPVVQTFMLDSRLSAETVLDGVLTLASAADLDRAMAEEPLASEQIAYGDVVLLNHCDRADAATLAALEERIHGINPSVPVVRAVRAETACEPLLHLGGHRPETWRFLPLSGPGAGLLGGVKTHQAGHLLLETNRVVDLGKLKLFLQFTAARRTWTLLRLKGIARCEGHSRAVVAHGIYQWLEIGTSSLVPPEVSQMMLIGRDLDEGELRRGWGAATGG